MAKVTLFWMIAVAAATLHLSESRVVEEWVETEPVVREEIGIVETGPSVGPSVVREEIDVVKTGPTAGEGIDIVETAPRTSVVKETDVYRSHHLGHHGVHGHRYVPGTHGGVYPYGHSPDVVITEDVYKTRPAETTYVHTAPATVLKDEGVVEEVIKFNVNDDDEDLSDD